MDIIRDMAEGALTSIRQVFEMMKADQAETVSNVTKRLNGIEAAFAGWKSSLEFAADKGKFNSRRQVLATAGQLESFFDLESNFEMQNLNPFAYER